MMPFVFIGLGNPGSEYEKTRHNAGWIILDELVKLWSDPAVSPRWKFEKKLQAQILRLVVGQQEIVLAKPQTYMNESGQTAAAIAKWYLDIDPTQTNNQYNRLLIIHDDLDLTTGQYKLQFSSGPKVHNGVNSVRSHLNSEHFWSGRIGVDSRGGSRHIPGQAYVLQALATSEMEALRKVATTLAEELPYTVLQ